jgi:hypothetical protein
MGTVDFDVFDADNHYYEATDAFIRHLPKHRSKLVQWADIDGKHRMIVDNKIFRFAPRSASSNRSTPHTANPKRA